MDLATLLQRLDTRIRSRPDPRWIDRIARGAGGGARRVREPRRPPRRARHAAAHRDQLRDHADRDLLRRARADLDAERGVKARDIGVREATRLEPERELALLGNAPDHAEKAQRTA